MKEPTKVSATISAGGQPSEEDIAALKAAGYRKIINLRRPGEQNQPLDPQAQGEVVTGLGMAYAHIPVDPKNLHPSSAAAVIKEIEEADGPVYVHCAPLRTHCSPMARASLPTPSSRRPKRSARPSRMKDSRPSSTKSLTGNRSASHQDHPSPEGWAACHCQSTPRRMGSSIS